MPKFIKENLQNQEVVKKDDKKTTQQLLPHPDDRLTQKEVANLFGTTVQTIINWKKKKILPYYQIGKRPIFSKKQLTEIAAKNQFLIK